MTKNTVCMAVAIMMWPVASAPGQTFIYVDVNAAGPIHDGSSWCSAYTTLDDALSVAASGVTILMADGTYRPDPAGLDNPREATFALINGVVIEGGYAGCGAPDPDERDLTAYETILSGDLADNDVPDFTYNEENCYHVLSAYNVDLTTAIDGLTITAGNANGDWWDDQDTGGGIRVVTASLTVMDCTIVSNSGHSGAGVASVLSDPALIGCNLTENFADHGGAIFSLAGHPSFTQCNFDGNTATYTGGGLHNYMSSPTLIDCGLSENWAYVRGGGMYNDEESAPVLTNCELAGNWADENGGGMCCLWMSNPTLTNCTLSGNAAREGGGMYSTYVSSPTLKDCVFSANSATAGGGAMMNIGGSSVLTHCKFTGNTAASGAGLWHSSTHATLINCTFHENAAEYSGGGLLCYWTHDSTLINCSFVGGSALRGGGACICDHAHPFLSNCTFSGNSADEDGGGIYIYDDSGPVLRNCVLWANSGASGTTEDAQLYVDDSTLAVNYTCVEGWTGLYGGVGNIGLDPQFCDPANGDLRLGPGSPCINTGDPYFVPEPGEADLDGHVRVLCDRVDMGAYEYGMGDIDCDRNVDLTDFAEWTPCLTGPDGGPIDSGCIPFDFDNDGDVDLQDFAIFGQEFTGPQEP